MAARKKTPGARKRPARKKAPARKKIGGRKKAARKRAARKKPTRKKAARKRPAGKKARRTTGGKRAAGKGASLESVARRIVKAASVSSSVDLGELYAEACISIEPGEAPPAEGIDAIRAKAAGVEALLESSTLKARNQWIKGNTIAIEWEGELCFKNGRSISFDEVAVHEIRGGKIVAERYYYDPAALRAAMGAQPSAPEPPAARPPEPTLPQSPPEPTGPSTPPPDPIDL
jgi:ketosteroid isomerase-like protein